MTITRESLLTLEAYAKIRQSSKPEAIAHRRLRSVRLGEHVTLQFEDEQTIRRQIQEMLHIEKIFDEDGIQSEIEAYAPLVPDGSNWKAHDADRVPRRARTQARAGAADRHRGPHVRRGRRAIRASTPSPTRTWSARPTRRPRRCISCASSSTPRRSRPFAPAPPSSSAATTPTTRRTWRSHRRRWPAWPATCAEPAHGARRKGPACGALVPPGAAADQLGSTPSDLTVSVLR